tara:strand:+ start:1522 stop:1830 length:309 start_codon:yes stop_codon:yes gene_type:complete
MENELTLRNDVDSQTISKVLNLISERNKEMMQNILKFVESREKIDKIEAGYKLIINSSQSEEINNLTNTTKEKIFDKALKETKGNEDMAISLLFDPSFDAEI